MVKRKRTNNDLQNTIQNTKDWPVRIPKKSKKKKIREKKEVTLGDPEVYAFPAYM